MSEVLRPDVVSGGVPNADQAELQLLNAEYSHRKQQVMVAAGVSAPLAIYGFSAGRTWAKTVGAIGLLIAALAYVDARKLLDERDNLMRGTRNVLR